MKHRKLLAAALTLVMALALAAPAFADEPGSIMINKPDGSSISISEQTFNVYRIFNLTMSDSETPSYAYTLNPAFTSFGSAYTANGETPLPEYVADLDDAGRTAFAKAVWEWIYNDGGSENATPTRTGTVPKGAETVTINNLPLGYYLVYGTATSEGETVIAACALTNADPDGTVILKVDAPTITKQVSDDDEGTFGDYTDLNIGDTAFFKLTSKVPNMNGYTSYVYTVHDTLSAGLTFDENIVVTVGSDTLTENTDYTINDNPQGEYSTESFIIEFDPDIFITFDSGDDIVITYSATLNATAVVGTAGNSNKVKLEYSNNPYEGGTGETPEDVVNVYTFKFGIYKYTLTDKETADGEGNRTALEDVEFALYADDEGDKGTIINFVGSKGAYRHALTQSESGVTQTLISSNDGKIEISGLEAGAYHLEETQGLDGYNPLAAPIVIKIDPTYDDEDGTLTSYGVKLKGEDGEYGNALADGKVNVLNSTGTLFPESGGVGRTIFTVLGLLLMFGAALAFMARRRKTVGN